MTIIFDTETTGLNSEVDEILQLSIIDDNENVLFNEYFKPLVKEEWEQAMAVHGITPKFVQNKKSIIEYKKEIQKIFANADVIIGYNLGFDMAFLQDINIKYDIDKSYIDVMINFSKIYGEWSEKHGNYKLKPLSCATEYYNYEWQGNAHDSLSDCLATLYCYKKMKGDN